MLVNNLDTASIAEKIKIPTKTVSALRTEVLLDVKNNDRRADTGQLELEFPDKKGSVLSSGKSPVVAIAQGGMLGNNSEAEKGTSASELKETSPLRNSQSETVVAIEPVHHAIVPETLGERVTTLKQEFGILNAAAPHPIEDLVKGSEPDIDDSYHRKGLENPPVSTTTPVMKPVNSTTPQRSEAAKGLGVEAANNPVTKPMDDAGSDLDSEEEVIVFRPRARRASGMPKKSEGSKSRPTTANGPSIQTPQSPLKTPTSLARARPSSSNGLVQSFESLKPKSQIESTLKAQSPVFTPGQLYIPSQPQVSTPAVASDVVEEPTSDKSLNGRLRQHTPKSAPPRSPRTVPHTRPTSQDQLQLQRQSEMIIQRQREAIQRQSKAAAKPPPRQIQMEPTENPTVIDPDAFDRSYVVQPPKSNTSPPANSKRRSNGHRRGSPKEGSPKRASKGTEPEIDFVLRSGAPRGSTRGKGKLWIP